MSGNNSKLIAFNYFGGKFSHCDSIYPYFPAKFNHLVDVFAGSFAMSINFPGNVIKTANEINGEVTNFFEVLRDHTSELVELLLLTPCSLEEYNKSWFQHPSDRIENARRYYVRVRQSFYGLGAQRKNKGWLMAKTKVTSKGGEAVSRWNNSIPKLFEVAEVIRSQFQIINYDYKVAIEKTDTENTFHYYDPPYPLECRKSSNDYRFEFTDEQHIELALIAHQTKGFGMISGYECELLDGLYSDWTKVKLPKKKNNIRSSEVQEVIWFNYPMSKTAKEASKYRLRL
ncbi:DNA adenine methylase [Aquimarina sp. 2201CG14-23]|uniref:DNA adenine methylase n=1 Tax=Aquimarina mycalae TaxID=3040073 RepID=UPI002478179A|nr:DNA adenine methylase [Aquimarina sp. 2201CG14-23]MDH7444657.1 DNA adenine methylase [Aquimarina sp. 2201CG14-23]